MVPLRNCSKFTENVWWDYLSGLWAAYITMKCTGKKSAYISFVLMKIFQVRKLISEDKY